jgi:hypothetical protein
MVVRRLASAVALAFVLAGCGGSSGGSAPVPASPAHTSSPGPSEAAPTGYVTPKFSFAAPAGLGGASAVTGGAHPAYISPASQGVTITLVSSSVGLSGVSASTDLTAPGVCNGTSCTVNGPPVPPGTDVFQVVIYDRPPTGTPPTEPAGANILSQSSSSATPNVPNPTVNILPAQNNNVVIPVFGVPAILALVGPPALAANHPATEIIPTNFQDHSGKPIAGQYAVPITVTDSDTGTQGTTLTLTGAMPGTQSVTINSSNDAGNLSVAYGGLAELQPTFTATAAGATPGTASVGITLQPIVLSSAPGPSTSTPNEIDLFAASGPGSSASFTAGELGWSNAPYSRTFTWIPEPCQSGAAPLVYSLTSADGLTFTDTAPAAPAAGYCTVQVNDFAGGQNAIETLTYTSGTFVINNRKVRH